MMNTVKKSSRTLLFASILSLALAATPALAQPGYGSGQSQAAQGMQKQDFDNKTLQKFVSAASSLGNIQNDFAEKLKGVQNQEEAMKIQGQMNEKMVKAVQNEGLEVQTYNAIANQMGGDEELRTKVNKLLQEQK